MKVWNALHLFLVILLSSAVPLMEALSITVCADRFIGISFADPTSCSSFYVCLRGNAIRRECSSGLYYDPKIQTCNLPGLIKCFNGDRGVALLGEVKPEAKPESQSYIKPDIMAKEEVTTTTSPPTTTVTTKKPKIDANDTDTTVSQPIDIFEDTPYRPNIKIDVLRFARDCRGITDGEYLTDPRHCRRYYICHKNRPKRHNCPRNQWFDRETKTCQEQEKVLNCPTNRN